MKVVTALVLALVSHCAVAQEKVEASGITALVTMEEVVSGHLRELNGKFKIRVTEITFAPGAHLGPHHHAGPGIRVVMSGELTFLQAGKPIVYKAGQSFYESGNVAHTAHNRSKVTTRVKFVEILPVGWSGPSLIAPRAH